jgi:hypothetical protein
MADKTDDERQEDLKKAISIVKSNKENGSGEEKIQDALVIEIMMRLVLDRDKIKLYEPEKIVLYMIDTMLANYTQLNPLAQKIKDEVMGTPKLLIPSRRLMTQ